MGIALIEVAVPAECLLECVGKGVAAVASVEDDEVAGGPGWCSAQAVSRGPDTAWGPWIRTGGHRAPLAVTITHGLSFTTVSPARDR